jgi:DNA-binding NarL/FixJ family response regulator
MLHELERDELSAVTVRSELIKAAAEKMATGGGDLVLAELCAWAWQNRDWSTLEQVWLVHGFAALLGNPAIAGWFAQTPPDARRDHPALSLPYATIAGLRDSTSPDLDRMIRALVQEGRLHSGWSRHENLDDAIRAGTLWMTSVGAFPAGTQGRPNEDAWRISQAIEDRLVQEAESGSLPSTAAEASFRGFSALVAISTGDVVEAQRQGELAIVLGEHGSFQALLGAWCLAVASLWLGERRGARRAQELLDTARDQGWAWWPVVAPLCHALDLARAARSLDRVAASAAYAAVRQVTSSTRWFNTWLVELWAVSEYGLLWAGPQLALNDFDTTVRLHEHRRSAYLTETLARIRSELLLNLGQNVHAKRVLDAAAKGSGSHLTVVPRARLELCLGQWSQAIAAADEGCRSPRVLFLDRAHLVAIKAAALGMSGASEDELAAAAELACQMCLELSSPFPVVALPAEMRQVVLLAHRQHLDDPDCGLSLLASGTQLEGLKQSHECHGTAPVLTRRERELLPLLAGPQTVTEIAAELYVSVHTVRKQVAVLRAKFRARTRAELISEATRTGYLRPLSLGDPARPAEPVLR